MQIDFKYNLKDKVRIPQLETEGFVRGVYYGSRGPEYHISYFHEGARRVEYFFEEELSESKGTMGFINTSDILKEAEEKTKNVRPGRLF
jgi:hypothetical protein